MAVILNHPDSTVAGRELNAFIYQQINEFESVLETLGGLSVNIEEIKSEESKETQYHVQFLTGPTELQISGDGLSENIYEACIDAKDSLKKKLHKIMNTAPQLFERDIQLDKNLLH